jgi:hypothetical protein
LKRATRQLEKIFVEISVANQKFDDVFSLRNFQQLIMASIKVLLHVFLLHVSIASGAASLLLSNRFSSLHFNSRLYDNWR